MWTLVVSRMSDLSIALIATAIVLLAAAVLALSLGRQAEEQHPSSNRFLTVNGVRLHYTASGGGGVPVVLIHGNTGDIADSLFRSRLEEAASKRQLFEARNVC